MPALYRLKRQRLPQEGAQKSLTILSSKGNKKKSFVILRGGFHFLQPDRKSAPFIVDPPQITCSQVVKAVRNLAAGCCARYLTGRKVRVLTGTHGEMFAVIDVWIVIH